MPILPESYVKKLDFKLQVYLERSAEMIEVNRRAMSSYHLVGRVMRVDLPLKVQYRKTQYPKTQNHHKLGQCGMFPLQKACNFSSSTDRTWYCYVENADCEPFEKSMKFTVTKTTNDMYGIADVLGECSVGLMRKTGTKAGHQVFKEENFQEIALETDYNKIVRKDPSIRMIQQSKFDHWCYGRYVTVAQDLDVLNTEVNNIRKEIKAIGNSHPISNSQLNKFAQKLQNRTIVVIGDSLSQQVLNFMENVVRQKSNCPEKWILFDFWGIKAGQDCTDRSGFNPKYLECKNEIIDTFTKFVFLPHGKPIHHGGCSRDRMPWMIDSVARIEKHADLNDRTVIILGPGAHFSAANPVYLFHRLLELKPVLIQFKKAHPEVKIIFKTPNYFPGDFYEQKAVISAFNG